MKHLLITTIFLSSCGFLYAQNPPKDTTRTTENELTMLIGTYTSGASKGIYSFRFNEENGTATPLNEVEIENPSYLVPSADGKFVYAVSEFNDGRASANAFAFDKKQGTFRLLNTQKTNGEDPCYIITNGKNVVTANYNGGSISVFPIAQNGSLLPAADLLKFKGSGIDKERQEKPHLHCVRITPDGKLTKAGYQLTGIHPRNFIITPNGKYLVVACKDSNVIQVYKRNAKTGLLTNIHKDIKMNQPVCIKFVP